MTDEESKKEINRISTYIKLNVDNGKIAKNLGDRVMKLLHEMLREFPSPKGKEISMRMDRILVDYEICKRCPPTIRRMSIIFERDS